MEVFLLLKYKHALLPIWEPSYFVLFKIPVPIKYCIYNVSLKESLQWQLKWNCILQFSISPSRAVSCLKNAKLRAQPAACTMWPCGSCQEPLLCCHRGVNLKVSFQLSVFSERAFGIVSSWKCNFCACTQPKPCFFFDNHNWWQGRGAAADPSVLSAFWPLKMIMIGLINRYKDIWVLWYNLGFLCCSYQSLLNCSSGSLNLLSKQGQLPPWEGSLCSQPGIQGQNQICKCYPNPECYFQVPHCFLLSMTQLLPQFLFQLWILT